MAAVVARTRSPRGEVVLRRRDDGVLELRVNGVFVMDTAETSTERALARGALDLAREPARVLVGGLGLGFTARALLEDARVERVDVVELEEALISWLREGTVPHGAALLSDPRLHLHCADVARVVEDSAGSTYDLVLLDVDNGPGYLVHEHNAALYGTGFLAACRAVLRPGGVLVIWSADRAPALAAALEEVFGNVSEVALPVRLQGRDEEYLLYRAQLPDDSATSLPPTRSEES